MYKDKKVIHIVCMDELGGIGKDNKLLFNIPEDLQHFRNKTLGHSLLCGRKTYDSFPKPLDRRIVLEISRKGYDGVIDNDVILECELDNAIYYSDLLNTDKIFIVGGASLYEQTADIVDTLLITEIKSSDKEADTFYTIPDGFIKVSEGVEQADLYNTIRYKFTKWEREVE